MVAQMHPDAAFAAVLEEHRRSMWVLARRLAGPDAADMVQEAAEQAWRTRHSYDEHRGTHRTWLLMIVADRCRKQRRRHRDHAALADHPATGPDQDQRLDLGRAVADLPPKQRLAVELHYVLGLSQDEVACVLGVAVGTVKSALFDARRSLRQSLEVRP